MLESRHRRNVALIAKLRAVGIDNTLEEVQAIAKHLTARPHFARVFLKKGYVRSLQEAFDLYLADEAKAAVDREEPPLLEAIERIRRSGGAASLAHPVRIPGGRDPRSFKSLLEELVPAGLNAIEVYHSEHTVEDVEMYRSLAREWNVIATGGSDFHGDNKPGVELGTGRNHNVRIEDSVLEDMQGRMNRA
jgi:3',5'-nucleoside bisphosphate phosphatase